MRRTNRVGLAAVAVATLALTACGGDDDGGSGGGGQAAGPIKLGVITSLSGPVSAGFVGVEEGIDARLQAYKAEGGDCADTEFEVVMGDDTSTPQGALAAAQKLVQQDDVYAVMPITSFGFGSGQYLATQAADRPVVGTSFDAAPQWLDENAENFFSANGSNTPTNISSVYGEYWKDLGGTKAAVVAVDTASSSLAAKAALQSGVEAGLEAAYENVQLPIGTTDVGAVVLGIKDSGADVLYLPVTPQTGFAIVGGLKQAGVTMKSILTPTGYGADLLDNPPALAAAEGVGFTTATAPIELDTEATREMSGALKEYAGSESGLPSFSQGQGWIAADLFLHGLELAGCDASQADYIEALRGDDTWDAGGLYTEAVDFGQRGDLAQAHGPGNCFFVSILTNGAFVPDENAKPVCGEILGKVEG